MPASVAPAAESDEALAARQQESDVVHFSRELAGAFSAALVGLPQALSLGVLAFAALGPEYAGEGVVAALLALVVGNLAASATYAVKCQMVGPRSASTALVAGLMTVLVAHPALQQSGAADAPRVIGLVFAAVVLAGLFQVVFGVLGFGRAIKYVPYPVVAGFMNGIAIIIVLSQLRAVLGLPGSQPLSATLSELGEAHWGSIVTAACVVAAIVHIPRLTQRVPPLLGGLAVGVAVHYAIAVAWPQAVGAVIGEIPGPSAVLGQAHGIIDAIRELPFADATILNLVLAQAALLAVVGALDGLLAAVVTEGVTRGRHDSNRLLMGQGIGNMIGGFLGAMPSQVNTHTPLASFAAGARTRLATLLHGLILLGVLIGLGSAVSVIPLAALAGIMLFIAYSLFDRWSGELVRRVRGGSEDHRGEIAVNIAIVAIVAAAQIGMNVITALIVGVTASVALLLVKLSQSPVRRHLDGAKRASHKLRSPPAREKLKALAHRIHVLELQGELFFGTADKLQSEVEEIPDDARFVILDFRRVHQIDASGARVLEVIGHRARRRGIEVLLADIRRDNPRGAYLHSLAVDRGIPNERWFPDLDRALEWAEDRLLQQSRFLESEGEEIPLGRMSLFQGLTAAEVERFSAALERIELESGAPIFLEGDQGDHLYLLAQGSVSIKMRLDHGEGARRLVSFSPGVMFGEMAMLEGKHRSADAFAKGERVVLYSLSAGKLDEINREAPDLGLKIHRNITQELAARLRFTTESLRALE